MKIETFKEQNTKKKFIITFTIICIALVIGVFFYHSYAWFESENTFNSFSGNVPAVGDIYFAVYVGEEASSTVPNSTSGYIFDHGECTNGASITWNDTTWSPTVSNLTSTRTKCTLYFEEASTATLAQLRALNSSFSVIPSTSMNPNFAKIAPDSTPGTNYDGESISIYLINETDTYITYASDFTYDETTGQYTLVNYTTCQYSSCYNDLINKYIIINDSYSCGSLTNEAIYQSAVSPNNEVGIVTSDDIDGNLIVTVFAGSELNEVKEGTWQAQTSGIYEAEDDYGTSYYFRGDITNNYVKFGTWQTDYYNGRVNSNNEGFTSLSACEAAITRGSCTKYASAGDDMYWRIIRINGDGTIRMIYDGTYDHNKEDLEDGSTIFRSIGKGQYNSSYNDNAYVGYMYGTAGSNNYNDTHTNTNDSTIKTRLDSWYQAEMGPYASYISDTLFCNDRSVASIDAINFANTTWGNNFTINAYGTNSTSYVSYGREIEQFYLGQGNKASLKCPNKNDAFTVSDTTKGNGALTYPVGLITADEANIAGATWNDNPDFYLSIGVKFWTAAPITFNAGSAIISVLDSGTISDAIVSTISTSIRPVINLKLGSIIGGDGTAQNPFKVELEE